MISIFKQDAPKSTIDEHIKDIESKGGKIKQRYDSEIMRVSGARVAAPMSNGPWSVSQSTKRLNCNRDTRWFQRLNETYTVHLRPWLSSVRALPLLCPMTTHRVLPRPALEASTSTCEYSAEASHPHAREQRPDDVIFNPVLLAFK